MLKFSLKLVASTALLTTGLVAYTPVPAGFWSSGAWAQQTQRQWEPRRPSRTPATVQPSSPQSTVQPSSPQLPPIALPVIDPTSSLGSALASCDKESESSESLSLPGAKGEVKLDSCYRGRDNLACSFNALLKEAESLLEGYRKIIELNYPNVSNVDAICRIKPNNVATDLQDATVFSNRFNDLKAAYDARVNCASRIEQSLEDVTLPNMVRATDILKSMIESLQGDRKGVSAVQTQLLELAEKMHSSRKAMVTIQRIHRAMCMSDQYAKAKAEDRDIGRR
jgi:hypothetical protein